MGEGCLIWGRRGVWPVLAWMGMAAGSATIQAQIPEGTLQSFNQFVRAREERQEQRARGNVSFLWAAESAERLRRVRAGEVIVEPLTGKGIEKIAGGLIHNWIGAVFIPGATLDEVFQVTHDYGNYKHTFHPDIIDSRLLSANGNAYRTWVRFVKRKVITLAFDAEYDVRYYPVSGGRWHSRSYSTRIAEVENLGKPGERDMSPEHSMLWRLYSYSRFEERDGGVYIECEGISLSRPFPSGLGWLIEPMVRSGARTAMTHLLSSTRTAVLASERLTFSAEAGR